MLLVCWQHTSVLCKGTEGKERWEKTSTVLYEKRHIYNWTCISPWLQEKVKALLSVPRKGIVIHQHSWHETWVISIVTLMRSIEVNSLNIHQTHKTTEQPMRIHSVIVLSLNHCLSWIPSQFQWEWSSKHDWIRTCRFLLHLSLEAFWRLPIPSVVIYYPITIISAPSCTVMLKWPIFCPSVQLNILNSACRAHQALQRC